LAADLVARQVAVIATVGVPAVLAAKAATSQIPITFATGADPVQLGLVSNLNRPDENLTGVEIDSAFATLTQQHAGSLLVQTDSFLFGQRDKIIALAARYALPAIYGVPEFAMAGGLMSYGISLADPFRQLGIYAGKILNGAKPADLPVQQSVKVPFVINLKTAKALGLTIPPSLLARADEVIE